MTYLADTASLFDMGKDRWFTRGWTLQELLAPQKIIFYSKNWEPLGATGEVEPGDSGKNNEDVLYVENMIEEIIEELPASLLSIECNSGRTSALPFRCPLECDGLLTGQLPEERTRRTA